MAFLIYNVLSIVTVEYVWRLAHCHERIIMCFFIDSDGDPVAKLPWLDIPNLRYFSICSIATNIYNIWSLLHAIPGLNADNYVKSVSV